MPLQPTSHHFPHEEPCQTKKHESRNLRAFSGPFSSSWGDRQYKPYVMTAQKGKQWIREINIVWRGNIVLIVRRRLYCKENTLLFYARVTFPVNIGEKKLSCEGGFHCQVVRIHYPRVIRDYWSGVRDWGLGIRDQGSGNRDQRLGDRDKGTGISGQGSGKRDLRAENWELAHRLPSYCNT